MNWKVKGLAQSALSVLPGANSLNYWCQKYVTRAHSNLTETVENRLEKARWFVSQFQRHRSIALGDAWFYEFGAGWSLAGPLALYCLGVGRQTIVDVAPCARLELVNEVIDALNNHRPELPRRPVAGLRSLAELADRFGILYRAPGDARNTDLPTATFHCITSTYTLEHIPRADVMRILQECRRILKPGGIILSMIDYQDHYSFRDSRISAYNFLQYPERQWRWFNSRLHYQNRLRHSQYLQMFHEYGFEMLSEELKDPSPGEMERLKSLRLSAEFQRFSIDDLAVMGSQLVCRKSAEEDSRAHGMEEHATSTR
jgi:SAM-dependent methyltransferase